MLTIAETAKLFGLPVYFVRSKVNAGEVVAVKAGRKFLVNVLKFEEYLNTHRVPLENKPTQAASVRPIEIRRRA
jgi:excisionase family DNA binding protein